MLKHRTAVNYSSVARLFEFYPPPGRIDGRKPCEKRRAVLRLLIPLSARNTPPPVVASEWPQKATLMAVSSPHCKGLRKFVNWTGHLFKRLYVGHPWADWHPHCVQSRHSTCGHSAPFLCLFLSVRSLFATRKSRCQQPGVSPQRQHRHKRHSLRFFYSRSNLSNPPVSSACVMCRATRTFRPFLPAFSRGSRLRQSVFRQSYPEQNHAPGHPRQ